MNTQVKINHQCKSSDEGFDVVVADNTDRLHPPPYVDLRNFGGTVQVVRIKFCPYCGKDLVAQVEKIAQALPSFV